MPGKGLEPLRAICTLEPESSLSTKFQHPGLMNIIVYNRHKVIVKLKREYDIIKSDIHADLNNGETTMKPYAYIPILFCAFLITTGCQSKALQTIFEAQEWENLAVAEGVTCNSPKMIDGNLKTVGYADGRWINLTLPKRKTIHRIIIRGTNITEAVIYQQEQGGKKWQAIMEIKNNRGPAIEARLSSVTQALRIFVRATADDTRQPPLFSPRYGRIGSRKAIAKAYAKEVEIYGFKSKDKK